MAHKAERAAALALKTMDQHPSCEDYASTTFTSGGGTSSADEFLDAALHWFWRIQTHGWEQHGRKVKDWRSSSPTVEPYWSWTVWSRSKSGFISLVLRYLRKWITVMLP